MTSRKSCKYGKYGSFEHCSSYFAQQYAIGIVLLCPASENDQVKALYRRGKAHAAVWDVKEANEDLQKAAELDPALSKSVAKELKDLEERVKEKEKQEKASLRGMFG